MRTTLLIVVLIGLVVIFGGAFYLAEFPPQPHTQEVQKVLPNDKFVAH